LVPGIQPGPVNPETLGEASAVVGRAMAGRMLGASGDVSVPPAGHPALPPGWSLFRGTLTHGASSVWVGHGLGQPVRDNVARELARCNYPGFGSQWSEVAVQAVESRGGAASSILGSLDTGMDVRQAVLVAVVNASGGLVSCDVEWSAHPGSREVPAGWAVHVVPLSLALQAGSLRQVLSDLVGRIMVAKDHTESVKDLQGSHFLLEARSAVAGPVPSGWASVDV
jgi:hypothetical protein